MNKRKLLAFEIFMRLSNKLKLQRYNARNAIHKLRQEKETGRKRVRKGQPVLIVKSESE